MPNRSSLIPCVVVAVAACALGAARRSARITVTLSGGKGGSHAVAVLMKPAGTAVNGAPLRWRPGPTGSLADGKATFTMEPGWYRVLLKCGGTSQMGGPFRASGGVTKYVRFALAAVNVVVRQRAGAPVPTASLQTGILTEGGEVERWRPGASAALTAGKVTFHAFRGTHRVQVRCGGTTAWSPAFRTSGSGSKQLTFATAELYLTVRGASRVQARLQQKTVVGGRETWRMVKTMRPLGGKATAHVLPGTYRLGLSAGSYRETIDLGDINSTRRITIDVDVTTGKVRIQPPPRNR